MASNAIEGTIIFSTTVEQNDKVERRLSLYFPSSEHSDTHNNKGNNITYAGIATLNLVRGRWDNWFYNHIIPMKSELEGILRNRLQLMVSKYKKLAVSNWFRIMKKKEVSDIIKKLKADIDEGYKEYLSFRADRDALLNRRDEYLKPTDGIRLADLYDDLARKKARFIAEKTYLVKKTQDARRRYLALKEDARIQRHLLVQQHSSEFYKSKIMELRDVSAMLQSARDKVEMSEVVKLLENPFAFGVTDIKMIRNSANEFLDEVKDLLIGAKSPEPKDATQRRREYRGNPGTPALNETGEFIEHLRVEVV